MIRGTDGVVGHPHTVFAQAAGRTSILTGRPTSLTGEIDEAFRQQLMAQHAKNADRRQERESRFMRERQASELAQQSKDRAVDDARAQYHEARQLVNTRPLTFENFCQLGATLVMLNRPSLKSEAALALLRAEVDYKIPQLSAPEMASIEERVAQEMAAMRHKFFF